MLSNNDGCVVARSQEAKTVGLRMGEPWFQLRERLPHVITRSSNYELYGSMSARVMAIITEHSAWTEVYSIDEAFMGALVAAGENPIETCSIWARGYARRSCCERACLYVWGMRRRKPCPNWRIT